MTGIVLEITRAVITGIAFFYLLSNGRKEEICVQRGCSYFLAGFAFLFFGTIIDITDNFPGLNKYIIIGDTGYEAFIEIIIGYTLGSLLLALGFRVWMPTVITISNTVNDLNKSHADLKLKVIKRTTELAAINNELELKITENKKAEIKLKDTIEKVNLLSGMLPICSYCKKIRDDKGYWEQVEVYIQNHSDAEFSHSLCPECARRLYPDYFKDEE
jgi:hypothetical protein